MISIPYALMKVNPLSWIQKVCLYKGKDSSLIEEVSLNESMVIRENQSPGAELQMGLMAGSQAHARWF